MFLRRFVRTYSSNRGKKPYNFREVFYERERRASELKVTEVGAIKRVSPRDSVFGKMILDAIHRRMDTLEALKKWKHSGREFDSPELNLAVRELRKLNRFKCALKVYEWWANVKDFGFEDNDYSFQLDLVSKVHGVQEAELFFEQIPVPMKGPHSHRTLLNAYVRNNLAEKAEALMAKMLESGLVADALPFNHMITLYMATGQLEKVPEVIRELKKATSPDVFTYNMWLTLCFKRNEVESADKVFVELKEAKVKPNFYTYSILISLYLKNGLNQRAIEPLKWLERSANKRDREAYSSLLTLRANMGDLEGVRAVWNKIKRFRITKNSEYICMISSLLKLGELKEAEELYAEWESVNRTKDSKVSNLLLAAYVNGDKMVIAEEFYDRISENQIRSFTSLTLLIWGFLKQKNVEKALHYFEAALKWKDCKPDDEMVKELLNVVEEKGNTEKAEKLLEVIRNTDFLTTRIYNSVLRTYVRAGETPLSIEERMARDSVQMDDETRELIKTANKTLAS